MKEAITFFVLTTLADPKTPNNQVSNVDTCFDPQLVGRIMVELLEQGLLQMKPIIWDDGFIASAVATALTSAGLMALATLSKPTARDPA